MVYCLQYVSNPSVNIWDESHRDGKDFRQLFRIPYDLFVDMVKTWYFSQFLLEWNEAAASGGGALLQSPKVNPYFMRMVLERMLLAVDFIHEAQRRDPIPCRPLGATGH